MKQAIREKLAFTIAPILARTGFRFSKDYRWGTTLGHRVVYACVNTIVANIHADTIKYFR